MSGLPLMPPTGGKTFTVEFGPTETATLQHLIELGMEHGDPVLQLALRELMKTVAKGIFVAMPPEIRQQAIEALDKGIEAIESGLPDELEDKREELREALEETREEVREILADVEAAEFAAEADGMEITDEALQELIETERTDDA